MIRLISWNIARSPDAWRVLAASDADIALLQEAVAPPDDVEISEIAPGAANWQLAGWEDRASCAAVARLSDRVTMKPLPLAPLQSATEEQLSISRPGSLAGAELEAGGITPITAVSVYSAWERPLGYPTDGWIYADANAHRLISDLSALIATMTRHRIIVAGDWNILRGYGEHSDDYWKRRYDTVFERLDTLGLRFVGPEATGASVQANPWPDELPRESRNVPTYRRHRGDPSTATRQLDFVFASNSIADQVSVRALNRNDDWGPSDHCRIIIDFESPA